MIVGAKMLRTHPRRVFHALERGEEVIVTYRGRPWAKLVPLNSRDAGEEKTPELFGIWADKDDVKDVDKYVESLRRGRWG
ncbi:type II toxin-antitoxin system Phd/YefM family antitoxin [Deferrisoma palaeochoriense]